MSFTKNDILINIPKFPDPLEGIMVGYNIRKAHGLFGTRLHTIEELRAPEKHRGSIYYFKGTNGAGKSTIPFHYALNDPDKLHVILGGSGKVLATICPTYKIAMVGKYHKGAKCGGADTLKDFDQMECALRILLKETSDEFDIIFEGVLPSTIFTSWVDRLHKISSQVGDPRQLKVVYLKVDADVAVQRVIARSGNVDSDKLEPLIIEKHKRIVSHIKRYPEVYEHLPIVEIDTNILDKCQTVQKFQQERTNHD